LDGTPKQLGFLGDIPFNGGGGHATEISSGMPGNPDAFFHPSMTPNLTDEEAAEIVMNIRDGAAPRRELTAKSRAFSVERVSSGKSAFWEPDDDAPDAARTKRIAQLVADDELMNEIIHQDDEKADALLRMK
jgi:hypothetical protein